MVLCFMVLCLNVFVVSMFQMVLVGTGHVEGTQWMVLSAFVLHKETECLVVTIIEPTNYIKNSKVWPKTYSLKQFIITQGPVLAAKMIFLMVFVITKKKTKTKTIRCLPAHKQSQAI